MPIPFRRYALLLLTCALPSALAAQDAEHVSQDADDRFDLGTLVLTTARRTKEALSDVPASVLVVSGDTLERSNVDDFTQAVQQLPNINVGIPRDPRSGEISIRGISSLNIAATAPTVGVFQNGVLQNATGLRFNNSPDLVDLERVEVLYGPQGTAYGRGTIGGAVNFVTAKPVFEQETRVTLSYSDLNEGNAELIYNTPLSDTLALRAVLYGDIEEGFISSPFAPTSNLGSDNIGTRISLRYQPTDRLTIDGSIQYDVSSYDAPLYATLPSIYAGNPISAVNQVPGNDIERLNLFFEVGYEFEAGRLTSTTGYLDSRLTGFEDFDFSAVTGSLLERDNEVKSFSQEIRFESRDYDVTVGTLSFNIGANYSDTRSSTFNDFQIFLPLPGRGQSFTELDVINYGVFGDLRWRPIDSLEIALGGRYSEDKVTSRDIGFGTGSAFFFGSPLSVQEQTFSGFTPNISILYDWTDDFATYATVSSGYKPGGFTSSFGPGGVRTVRTFDEEEAVNYEVGVKSNFFDGALQVNASLFAIDYTDIQVPIPFTAGGGVGNAASALSEGAEVSVFANPLPGLTLSGAFGYTNARFLNYDAPIRPLAGERLPNAPEFTYGMSADYEFEKQLGQFTPFVRAEVNGTSGFVNDAGSTLEVGNYHLLNLRAGLRGDTFDVTFFVENVFDEDYVQEIFTPPPPSTSGPLGVPGESRKIGFLATARF